MDSLKNGGQGLFPTDGCEKPVTSSSVTTIETVDCVEHGGLPKHAFQAQAGVPASPKAVPRRRVKLVFLIRSLAVGGAERQLVELAKGLDRDVYDVTVLCFYRGGAFVSDLLSAGVPVIFLDKRKRREVFRFLLRLAKQLREQRPDILHGYMMGPNLMAMLMKPILGSTQIVWGVRVSNINAGSSGWAEWLLSRLEALLSPLSSLVVFNSAAGESYCRTSGFRRARTIVIPNGTDVAHFSPQPDEGAKIKASWGLPADSLVVGRVGRMDPMKDYPTFLKAASLMAQSMSQVRFACIGGGQDPYIGELRLLAGQLGLQNKLVWTGIIDNMPAAYSALDICCSSSVSEGSPNCVAEAMACGVPCVVTDVGDSRLVVGETGVVVPPKDPEALAMGLETMVSRIAQYPELGKAARERIVASFSVPTLVAKTSEALLALV